MKKRSLELKKKRLEKKIKRILFLFVFPFILLFSIFIIIFNSNFLSIKKINLNLESKEYIDEKKINLEINKILNEKYFSIFSKRNYLFYPADDIKEIIEKKYPEINNIDIGWNNFAEDINIKIKEEKSKYVYCKTFNKDNCYEVSSGGKIFYKVINKIEDKIILSSKQDLKKGDMYFKSKEEQEKILYIINYLNNSKKIKVVGFLKENDYLYKIILFNNTKIILSYDFDIDDIVFKINKMLNLKNFSIINKRFKKNIAYIDLSLKSRITYCDFGDICEKNY